LKLKKNLTVFDLQRFAADASAGLAGTGTKLEMSVDGTKFDEIGGIKTVPDMGSDPENIDVTDLSDDEFTIEVQQMIKKKTHSLSPCKI
jgi:hypothetical protein